MPEACWEKKRQAERLEETAIILSQEVPLQTGDMSQRTGEADDAFGPRAR